MNDQDLATYRRGCKMTARLARDVAEKLVLLAALLEVEDDGATFEELGERFLGVSADIDAYRASYELLERLWAR